MKDEILNQIRDAVCQRFSITLEQFFSKSQRRDIVDARYVFYYLADIRRVKNFYIRKYMEQNGFPVFHSNIIYGVREMRYKVQEDKDYEKILNEMQRKIN